MTYHSENSRLIIGCVSENTPKYLSQALRLVQSIRWFGGAIAKCRIIVCVVDGIDSLYNHEFLKFGAEIRIVERFSIKHPQSNKLRFLQLEDVTNYKHVLLLDCDTLIVQDPTKHLLCEGLRGKIADGPTVSTRLFRKLFDFFHLPMPREDYACTVRGTATIPYFNAGVLLFSQAALATLIPAWISYNQQLISQIELLGSSSNYCEQASLSLAVIATGIPFKLFENDMNFPTHHNDHIKYLEKIDPFIIHYHNMVNQSGYIQDSKYLPANIRISMFNAKLREEREKHFDNKLFWNSRYLENPDLGSGAGSRGESLEHKRKILKKVLDTNKISTILDVGCGDMEVSSILPSSGYTGLDISDIVIERNKRRYPDRSYLCGNFLELDLQSADMVVCLDVLIHLNDYEHYIKFIAKLIEKTIHVGLIAGYDNDPKYRWIVFFHEPLSETLKRLGVKSFSKLGCYRDTDIFMFNP